MLAVILFVLALGMTLYPVISNYVNQKYASEIHTAYQEVIQQTDNSELLKAKELAVAYNNAITPGAAAEESYSQEALQTASEDYNSLLNITGEGTMGYVEIPGIQCSLPVYHGTDEAVLQVAVGHLEWSSLPTGGESTHCVLSGHRGLPSAKLFTDLDKVEKGDLFMLRILDELLTYEVDRIEIVEPHETQSLLIEEGKDLCTLVTCTPYGINSHRLLVRGHRVSNVEETLKIRVVADAILIEPLVIAPIIGLPVLWVILGLLMLGDKKDRKK